MLDREGVVEAFLVKIGAGGVFHVNAVSILGIKCGDDAVVGREQIPHTVPGVINPSLTRKKLSPSSRTACNSLAVPVALQSLNYV